MALVGQAGPQAAAPEELVTIPAGAVVGGMAGGIGGSIFGGIAGTEVAETVFDWYFTPLKKEKWVVICEEPGE